VAVAWKSSEDLYWYGVAPMSRVNPDKLPGNMVVLGLVIEQPEATVKEVQQLVRRRFRRACFAPNTAHGALPRLAERRGEKIPCVERTYKAPGKERSRDRYRATTHGIKVFRAWMYDLLEDEETIGQPSLQEAMLGRIELARVEDLPRLIQMAHKEADVSADLYAAASLELRKLMRRRADPLDFERKIREVLLYVDPAHWSERATRYREIADRLEDIKREAQAAGVRGGG
jgi:hypothetical protein